MQGEHVAERVRAVVVLDHQPGAGALREPLEARQEAVHARVVAARRAADVQHDHRLGPEAHRVEQPRLQLEVADRAGAHGRVLGVEDDVLAGVGREPHVELARPRAERGELARGDSSTWRWNCGRSGCVA